MHSWRGCWHFTSLPALSNTGQWAISYIGSIKLEASLVLICFIVTSIFHLLFKSIFHLIFKSLFHLVSLKLLRSWSCYHFQRQLTETGKQTKYKHTNMNTQLQIQKYLSLVSVCVCEKKLNDIKCSMKLSSDSAIVFCFIWFGFRAD